MPSFATEVKNELARCYYEDECCRDAELAALVRERFDLRPAAIIDTLDLRRPIYRATAAYGHFGRQDVDLPWERLNAVERLK